MRPQGSRWSEARSILLRHAGEDRLSTSVLPGLHLMRFGWASRPVVAVHTPCMALVIQGTKSIAFGPTHLEYSEGQYLLTSIDMPATSRIVSATNKNPLLALGVDIDFAELGQLIQRCDRLPESSARAGINVFDADADLVEAVVRLLRLLDTPEHARALAPLMRQEILYRLLAGPSGSRLLEISRQDSPGNRVAQAIHWLREHFAEGFLVEELARQVGMSPSSFHQHFKAVTGMTPIQYQRGIRMHEARRILVVDSADIGEASFRVGYQSPSQFSKDYRHYFGKLPKDDVRAHVDGGIPLAAYSPA
ncbi:MAG: AraC family transcriptional regulator [Acidobacteriota bacterium]